MPNAVHVELAHDVTDLLNGAELSKPFTAEYTYEPEYNLSENPGLKLFVIPTRKAIELNGGTRSESSDTLTVMVGIYNTIERDEYGVIDANQVDEMLYFTEEIELLCKKNSRQGEATLQRIDIPVAYDPDRLEQQETFLTVVSLDYLVYSER